MVVGMYSTGKSTPEIAAFMQCEHNEVFHPNTINMFLKRSGIALRSKSQVMKGNARSILGGKAMHDKALERDLVYATEVVTLHQDGFSPQAITRLINAKYGTSLTRAWVRGVLERQNVEQRTSEEAHACAKPNLTHLCEGCGEGFAPTGYNQRWCELCSKHKGGKGIARHGLPASEIKRMWVEQDSKCKLCGKNLDCIARVKGKECANLDHDHVTDQVRGLLCNRCNVRLASLEDPAWLSKAWAYLENGKRSTLFVRPSRKHRYIENELVIVT